MQRAQHRLYIKLFSMLIASLCLAHPLLGIAQIAAPADLVQRGAYLARAGDCGACHSSHEPAALPYAGGVALDSAFGKIWSTNITPDPDHGIGRYSFEDFDRVMRSGVTRDGHRLYPAMPYPSFVKISANDMQALYAYFMHGVSPAATPNRATRLNWPFSMRGLMAGWNFLYLKKGPYDNDMQHSPSWNRGAYLVQGLGHCGACHTPRNLAGAEKSSSEREGRQYLAGALVDQWFAASLSADLGIGLEAWSADAIAEYLKTGRTQRSAAFGAMSQVIAESTQYLSDDDRKAIAEYLKALPPSRTVAGNAEPSAFSPLKDNGTDGTSLLHLGKNLSAGAQLYLDNCSACHRVDGQGAARTFPALAQSEIVSASDASSLIHIVLTGSAMPATQSAPSALTMPDFAWRLSDADIADVLNFVRTSWGNHGPVIAANMVGRMRKNLSADKAQ